MQVASVPHYFFLKNSFRTTKQIDTTDRFIFTAFNNAEEKISDISHILIVNFYTDSTLFLPFSTASKSAFSADRSNSSAGCPLNSNTPMLAVSLPLGWLSSLRNG
jgi:hypothetical protein